MTTIGFLHPGQMGVTIAATTSADAVWAGAGRSPATSKRAASANLTDVGDVGSLCDRSDIVVSICPPAAAVELAQLVRATGFDRTYIDANAISPATSKHIGTLFEHYIDGGVIGPPATTAGTTRMYLAGPGAERVAGHWAGSALDVRALTDSAEEAAASALKMAYAGWTKGSSALLLAINALARSTGVTEALQAEWDLSQPGLSERSRNSAAALGHKAWRFSGEMTEIAETMAAAGLPDGFHDAAADLYGRMAGFKEDPDPTLSRILDTVLDPTLDHSPGRGQPDR